MEMAKFGITSLVVTVVDGKLEIAPMTRSVRGSRVRLPGPPISLDLVGKKPDSASCAAVLGRLYENRP